MTGDVAPKLWVPRVILDTAKQEYEARDATSVHIQALGAPNRPRVDLMRSLYAPTAPTPAEQKITDRFPMGRFYDDMIHLTGSANAARAMNKPMSMLSHRALRMLSRGSIIDRLIINARKAQARRFARVCDVPGKQFGFRVVHRRYQDSDFDSDTDEIRKQCAEMDELIRRPTNPPHGSFGDYLENLIEEELVLDRRFTVLPQGRNGKPISYHLIDGATVFPRMEVLGNWMIAHNMTGDIDRALAMMQMDLWKNPPKDRATGEPVWVDLSDAEYVQLVNDRVIGAWKKGEYHIGIAHSTVAFDSWGYGYSMLEDSYTLSLLFLEAMRFNKNLFDVNFPEAILVIAGQIDPEGLKAFRRNVLDYDRNEASARLPIVPGSDEMKAEVLKLRDTPRDMMMSEMITMLANWKCAAYRMHPSTINVQPDGQGGAVVSVDSGQGDEIAQATEEGFHSLMQGQCDLLTEAVVRPHYPDLIVIAEGLDRETDQARISRLEFEGQYMTFNELRAELSKKPLPKGLPVEIGDFVAGQGWMQAYQAVMGQQQQQQQQDMGQYGQGDFGQPQGGAQPGQPWQGDPSQQPGQPGQPGQPPGQPGDPSQQPGPAAGPPGAQPEQQGWQQTQGRQQQAGLQRSRDETITIHVRADDAWEESR